MLVPLIIVLALGATSVQASDEELINNFEQEERINITEKVKDSEHEDRNNNEGRIVGGTRATRGQFPYFAGIFTISSANNDESNCGGSLISSEWVLTAAHCVYRKVRAEIYFGTVNFGLPPAQQPAGTIIRRVNSANNFKPHPNYRPLPNVFNDIGLIKLNTKVTNNQYVFPLRIAINSAATYVGQRSFLAGFGSISDTQTTKLLYFTNMPVVSNQVCFNVYGPSYIRKDQLCTDTRGPHSPCYGDSGGPLTLSNNLQIGIVSFGDTKSCSAGTPTVFTRINNFKGFIQGTTGLAFN